MIQCKLIRLTARPDEKLSVISWVAAGNNLLINALQVSSIVLTACGPLSSN